MKNSWYKIQAKGAEAKISIHDEIGLYGVDAKTFMAELDALEGVEAINLSIHSPGGDVIEGWAMYNKLVEHPAHVTAKVEGFAGSMASVILMAADHIVVPENAFIMIHNPWAMVGGDAQDMIDMADSLQKIQKAIVSAYATRTGLDEDEIEEYMARETWMDGIEAAEKGFADEVTKAFKAAACAENWRDKLPHNLPKGLVFGTPKTDTEEPKPEPKNHPKTEPNNSIITMSETPKADEPKVSIKDALAADKPRRDEIAAIGQRFGVDESEVKNAIENGVELESFKDSVISNFVPSEPAINAEALQDASRVNSPEAKEYSLFKAIKQHVNEGRLDGLEKEVQEELSSKYRNATGKVADGLLIPAEYWNASTSRPQNASTAGTGTSGGNTVGTEMQEITDYLRDYSILPKVGATIFRDSQGNLEFPRSTAGYTGTFDAETDTISNADATFAANLVLTPKRVGAGTAVSKQLLAQSSVDFEAWVRGELQYGIASAIDRAAINGAGGDAPTGVLNASGTDAYTWNSANALWTNIVDQIADYRDNNAPLANASWLTDTSVWAGWYKTQLAASTGTFVIEEDVNNNGYSVAGRPFCEHTDVTAGKVILGDFSQLFVALWGGIQLTYDPYSQKKSGQVELYAETFADCGLLQPNSFVIGDDGTAHAGALS